MRITMYDKGSDTLFIRTEAIMPKHPTEEQVKKAFSMSYSERIARFAGEVEKLEIQKIMDEHPGCKVSEFTGA